MVQKKLPLINSAHGSDTRNIINELIKLFNNMGYTYDEALQKAHNVLSEAQKTNDMNKDVQNQIDDLILQAGESDAEVINARGSYDLLRQRLDASDASDENIIERLGWNIEVSDEEAKLAFMDEANKIAKRFGMSNSHFITPSGQFSEGHISTTNDLLRLGLMATEYNDLVSIWSKKTHTYDVVGPNERTVNLTSTVYNSALDNHYNIAGGKTGTVDYVYSLISVVERPNSNDWLVGVVQGRNEPPFANSKELYDVGEQILKDRERQASTPQTLLSNGDFSGGMTDWSISAGSPNVSNGRLIINSTTVSSQVSQNMSVVQGHKYYISFDADVTRYQSGFVGIQHGAAFGGSVGITGTTNGEEYFSSIETSTLTITRQCHVGALSSANLDGYIDNVVIVDLTAFYGVGNEPTASEFEANGFDLFDKPDNNYDVSASNAAVALKPPNAKIYEGRDVPMLFTKNGDTSEHPASTTKVLSVITAIENCENLDEILEIKDFDIAADVGDIAVGDKLTVRDALHCMLLPSSNIAAMAVARHVGEKIEKRRLSN